MKQTDAAVLANDRDNLAKATSFNVHVRLSPFNKINVPCSTLFDAVQQANGLTAEHAGKTPMIYAIHDDGSSHLVPAALLDGGNLVEVQTDVQAEPAESVFGKIFAKKDSARKAAYRAGLKPLEYEIGVKSGAYEIRKPTPITQEMIEAGSTLPAEFRAPISIDDLTGKTFANRKDAHKEACLAGLKDGDYQIVPVGSAYGVLIGRAPTVFARLSEEHAKNVAALGNFKIGDRVEWDNAFKNAGFAKPVMMGGEVIEIADVMTGELRVRLEGTENEAIIGARLLFNVTAEPIDIPAFLHNDMLAREAIEMINQHAEDNGMPPLKERQEREITAELATPQHEPEVKAAQAKAPRAARQKPSAEKAAAAASAAKGTRKPAARFVEAEEAAKRGELPLAPDFSAHTHRAYRKRLAAVVEMILQGDIAALEAEQTQPLSPSRKMLCRFRDLAIIALKVRYIVDATKAGI